MSKKYAIDVIQDMYSEGDRDYIFIENIIGLLAYDEFDEPSGLSDGEVFSRAMKLLRFLTESGDFEILQASSEGDSRRVSHVPCKGSVLEVESLLRDEAKKSTGSNFFNYKFVLRKTKKGIPFPDAPGIPNEILKLWGGD